MLYISNMRLRHHRDAHRSSTGMKISARINGRITSIRINPTIAALHYVYRSEPGKDPVDHVHDACYPITQAWGKVNGTGLSKHLHEQLLIDLLEPEDTPMYFKAKEAIQDKS